MIHDDFKIDNAINISCSTEFNGKQLLDVSTGRVGMMEVSCNKSN